MTDMSAYEEAAVDLGKSIAIGAVPVLGQLIDLYDTLESALAVYKAQTDDDKENAQFDLLLAIVGWVPGPGDGVKRSLRIVNRDPQRFAPVLFDLLRRVLHLAGIETSPEALLQGIFDSGYLRGQMDKIQQGVQDYSGFQALPEPVQKAVMNVLAAAALSIPMMVAIVEKRLLTWKRVQRNSSAREPSQGHAKQSKPEKKDPEVHKTGKDGASPGHAGESVKAVVAEKALHELTNEIVGISGEHIADYMCAYSAAFGWGKDWSGHDLGGQGHWTEGTPGKTKQGKLSKGGNPKEAHALYKLADGANGTGIDAVWRADRNNGGKPYAIVEAKASRNEDAPKFGRKPSTPAGMLGVIVKGEVPITDPVQIIEPIEDESAEKAKKPGGKPNGKPQRGAGGRKQQQAKPASGKASDGKAEALPTVMVQMSHEWIGANIGRAISQPDVLNHFKRLAKSAYSRHLFFSPRYHPSGSPDMHFKAKHDELPENSHAMHDAFHYDESAVRAAVNKRKAALRKKHGDLASLQGEK